jgi:transcriptional regulator with XRE-family HTH domain
MAHHPVDQHVGQRLRIRRALLGMSQADLANAVGLTFQQVHKYECGTNRMSARRLWQCSQILDVPVSYFFDDLPSDVTKAAKARISHGGQDRLTLESARRLSELPERERRAVHGLIKSLAAK